ncbi:MAG: transketolase [Dehalococcoidia bacterium]|nr:transketolase [Dehalococcoidia bacterium]
MDNTFERLCINTIRFLAVDAIEKAGSGHPGAPMGQAPLAYTLWQRFLKHNPTNPNWVDRDRFILSCGHASMLQYALLYLNGYDITLEDLKNFRQWDSKTPGHPERLITPGVEATTGPLGQGFVNGVGMAIAERHLAARFNRSGFPIVDHFTYAICSDGDLMEGITAEAGSLAGTLKLGKLIYLYDSNNISIEGNTEITFQDDTVQRFKSYGWQVIGPLDGMSTRAVDGAIREAQAESNRPSLIICKTTIGFGSPNKSATASAHGEPLGKEETLLTKQNLYWPFVEPFTVPEDVLQYFRNAQQRGYEFEASWQNLFNNYAIAFPEEARLFTEETSGTLPQNWDSDLCQLFSNVHKPLATREASGIVINAIASKVPALMGGSADLAPSTKTLIRGSQDFAPPTYEGRNIRFGIREHAMGAIAHGMALHGGVIPYTATFLMFYDYMRAPVRLTSLTKDRVVFLFTHDSIGVGEDGPTHQPIEQLSGLRSVPDLVTIRPADATETAEAWRVALTRQHGPTAIVLTRQALPIFDRQQLNAAEGLRRGAYILWQTNNEPNIILIASGSEVHIALEAAQALEKMSVAVRVISMPSWELFEAQDISYQEVVLPSKIKKRISIEAGLTLGWCRYTGSHGVNIGINCFGASAPSKTLYEKFGLDSEKIIQKALELLNIQETPS